MPLLLRHLVIFVLLGISILGVIYGIHEHTPNTELPKHIGWLFGAVVGILFAYLLLIVALALLSQSLFHRSPLWADRLARLQGRLTSNQTHRITLLALHKDNHEQADRLWSEVEPLLPGLRSSEAMALATNYSASLSARGHYTRARDVLIANEPKEIKSAYKPFYALYWLNLGFCQHQLDDLEAAQYCLRRTKLEHISLPLIQERRQSLEALLAVETGDRQAALDILRQPSKKSCLVAFGLANLGEIQEAGQLLPELRDLRETSDRYYYHLAQSLIHQDPKHLEAAAALDYPCGRLAYVALQNFQNSGYLAAAEANDPESTWTRRARELL